VAYDARPPRQIRIVRTFVYILRCSDGSYYTGITRREVDEPMREHAQGFDPTCYTFSCRPLSIVFSASFERLDEGLPSS
jgi:putative endonuclease